MSVMPDPRTAIYPFPPKPAPLSVDERRFYHERIKHLPRERNVVMVTHYYTDPEIQQLAEEIGGCISDSLEMACFGSKHPASTLLVVGVRFMGETAEILSPEKTILMSTLQAECSLDLGCPIDAFSTFCDAHLDRTVMVYVDTSATVRARADWVVTSSTTVELTEHLDSLGGKTIWVPGRYLGNYIQKQTDADTLCWQGACIIHDEFKTQALTCIRGFYPDIAVLVRPKSPQSIVDMADAVGSTSQLINAAKSLPCQQLVVTIDRGISYKMQQVVSGKGLFEAPAAGEGATRRSCAYCPWVAMNGLKAITKGLERGGVAHGAHIDTGLREEALLSLSRMLEFAVTLRA